MGDPENQDNSRDLCDTVLVVCIDEEETNDEND